MAKSEIDQLKAALGATTDQDLARELGIERSTVTQWKRRGNVPAKYRILYRQPSREEIGNALQNAHRHHLYGRRGPHYWIKAALALMPEDVFARNFDTVHEKGNYLEAVLLDFVSIAMNATNVHLQKSYPENEADYQALIEIMAERYPDAFRRAVGRQEP